jgi:hypothetical protein
MALRTNQVNSPGGIGTAGIHHQKLIASDRLHSTRYDPKARFNRLLNCISNELRIRQIAISILTHNTDPFFMIINLSSGRVGGVQNNHIICRGKIIWNFEPYIPSSEHNAVPKTDAVYKEKEEEEEREQKLHVGPRLQVQKILTRKN